jgi:hypothetical protein
MIFSSKRLCVISSLAVALVISLTSAASRAADEEPEDLIRQGVQLRKRGEDAKAHGYFQRAYDIARTPRTSAQLGLSDLSVDKWLDAEVHLTEALSFTDPWIESNMATLESSRATARTHLGKIEIDGAPPEATIEATGRPITKLPADGAIWVSAGTISLRLQAAGFQPATQDATVATGGTARVHVAMTPIAPAVAAGASNGEAAGAGVVAAGGPAGNGETSGISGNGGETTADQLHSHRTRRIAGVAVAGAGVAVGVLGLVLWRVGTGKADAATSDGTASPPRPYNPSNDDYKTLEQAGVGLLIGGGALVAAGVVGYVLNRDKPPSDESGVSVGIGPGQFGALIGGRF